MTVMATLRNAPAILCAALLTMSVPLHAAEYEPGKHYDVLLSPVPTANPDKIEVVELFWYGCPHCYTFEPVLSKWTQQLPEDVDFQRMPAVFSKRWETHAKAYYAAEILGVVDETHQPLFDAIHRDRKSLNGESELADFYAAHGVDKDKFIETYNSFGVQIRMQQAAQRIRGYRVTGVPTLIVDGRYRVRGGVEALEIVEFLIDKERKARAATAAANESDAEGSAN